MAKAFTNTYRQVVSSPANERASTGQDSYGLHETENPMVSFDVDIPSTPSVKKIQNGQYKLDNNTDVTGLNNDAAIHIVGNTYQENDDGTFYGMGWDGRPYSYTIKDNIVGNFTPLGADEQRAAISKLTNGQAVVDESINNPSSLAAIYRSLKRMQDSDNGKITPGRINISDPNADANFGLIGGMARPNSWYNIDNPDEIQLLSTNHPEELIKATIRSKKIGYHPVSGADTVAQHELAHTADFKALNSPERYVEEVARDAEKYDGKYSAGELFNDAIGKIKYAIPVLMDSIFGTHFVPSEGEIESMYESDNENDVNTALFWDDYYDSPLNHKKTVGEKMYDKAVEKADKFLEKYGGAYSPDEIRDDLFSKAAENAGFESVEDAAGSISGYATENKAEAFAEAYSDVLLNRTRAKRFSKELMKVYSDFVEEANKTFNRDKPVQLKALNELFNVLSEEQINSPKEQLSKFQRNYQRLSR